MPDPDRKRRKKLLDEQAKNHRKLIEKWIKRNRKAIEGIPDEQWKRAQENDAPRE